LSPFGAAFYRDLIYITLIKVFHIRIVFHLHGKGIKQLCKYKIRQLFYKYAFRNSDIICLSDLLKSDLEDVYKGTIHIVNNGIPDELIIDSETQKSHEKLQILFLSNLLKSKGIIDFIESLKILSGKDITFYANILGAEGDIEPVFLNDKIRELNLSNEINYLGTKTGEEKNKIIEGSDVLIYPSLNDAFPLVLLEVMRYAKPIIATREGAIPEIVDDGRTGFLVEKHNPGQISEKLEVFVRNPGLIKIMGDAGRKKFLQNYTMDIFESNLKNVFEEVLTNLHQRND
jgi:glycosyltransferase involved in cell wall biosynthesis